MSPGERVARIGSTRNDARANKFISKQKEKEKAFEKKKKKIINLLQE